MSAASVELQDIRLDSEVEPEAEVSVTLLVLYSRT